MECGSALVVSTTIAQIETPPASDRPVTPERRFVSVVFADLVGFTDFSEGRDPEDVRAMLTSYFDRSRAIVERYSGQVDKFIGDALMAVWGAVEAHEDDPERATRAALELVDMVGELGAEIGVPGLRLRAGVLSGETSVGPGGNEKGLVVGDMVNTASRLQSLAEPGTVYVGAPTYELVSHVVEFAPMGEHEVKGKEERVVAFRAERVIAGHRGRRRSDSVEPPFVGRDDELRLLKDALHAVARENRARLVSIVGEAGTGKSRLAWELFKYIDGLPERTYWHQGRSPSYGDGLTLWSLGEMLRRRAGIAETDEPGKSRMKLRTALAEYVPDDDERRWLESWLSGLLGLNGLPDGDRTELFAALRTFFHRVADLGQTVLVFEDLQWADQGVLDFIEEFVSRSQHHPILVVTLGRPEILDRQPSWGSGRGGTAVRLAPLPTDAMARLVTGMVPGVPDDAVGALVDQAAGIPLYAVEFVRMLLTSGEVERHGDRFVAVGDLSGLSVPDSLQAVVGARIDRLDADERTLVQNASVLGQSFTIEGLRALGTGEGADEESLLAGLVRKELFEFDDDPRSPERGQYQFVQSVVREVAYGRLGRTDRYVAHRQVAQYFESVGDPELVGAVAGHLVAARDSAPPDEAKALEARALAALHGAAQRAAALHSDAQVVSLCRQAIETSSDDQARLPFRLLRARSLEAMAEPELAIEEARTALAAAEACGSVADQREAATLLGSILGGNWHSADAVVVLTDVYETLEDLDTPEAVRLAAEMGRALMLDSQFEPAIEFCDRALRAAEPQEMTRTIIDAIITKGTALGNAHRPLESILLLQGAADLADRNDMPGLAIRALNNRSVIEGDIDPRANTATWEDLLKRTERLGARRWRYQAINVVAGNRTFDGRFDEAMTLLDEVRREPLPEFWVQIFALREAVVELMRNPSDAALNRAHELIAYWDDSHDAQLRPIMDLMKAGVDTYAGKWEAAYERSIRVARDSEFMPMWGMNLLGTAAVWSRHRERIAASARHLESGGIVGPYAAGLRSYLAGADAALAGDLETAATEFASAIALIGEVGTASDLAIAQATFYALVGDGDRDAVQAGRAAADWIAATGARILAETFGAGLPAARPAQTASA
jgi:class 3 adenylate cyclase